MEWIKENANWVFSGVGAALLIWLLSFIGRRKKRGEEGSQQALGNNVKAGGNVTLSGNVQSGGQKKGQEQRMGQDIKAGRDVRIEDNEQHGV